MKKCFVYIGLFTLLAFASTSFAADLSLAQASELDSDKCLIRQLQAKNEELQNQQELLLKRIVGLKQRSDAGAFREISDDSADSFSKQEYAGLKQELEESNAQIEREKSNVSKLADYIINLRNEIAVKEKSISETYAENIKLKTQIGNLQAGSETCKLESVEKENTINDLKKCNERTAELETMSSTIPDLRKEIMAAKNELLMKDAELEQLGKKSVKQDNQQAKNVVEHQRGVLFENSGRNAGLVTLGKKPQDVLVSDVTIIEVMGDKVALRSGPSPDDSEIMSVARATRLTVEERTGDWYRVVAPNSMRAFVRADMVRVISKNDLDMKAINDSQRAALDDQSEQAPTIVRPKKKALRTINTNNMAPIEESASKEKVDRAFEKLKSGLSLPKSDN